MLVVGVEWGGELGPVTVTNLVDVEVDNGVTVAVTVMTVIVPVLHV